VGWPLLTFKTEANGDSWSTYERGPSLQLVRWSWRAVTIDFSPALAALVSLVQNIIFLTAHFFTLTVPIAQQPGPAAVLGRLSLCLR
jgi:hypothetical protein